MAVLYDTYLSFCDNLRAQCNAVEGMEVVAAAIFAVETVNPGWAFAILNTEQKHDILVELTGCTAALNVDVNAYPRGYETAQLYDLNGNPIP